jgi:PIN domain nuclease of toxin-antitoxin system
VNLLLDTHALLWWLDNPALLSPPARAAIAATENLVYVSAAVAWEISIKHALGKLRCPDDLEEQLKANHFRPLSVSIAHAMCAGGLPAHHTDPFDRMLVAQAQMERLTLVTRDKHLHPYAIDILVA